VVDNGRGFAPGSDPTESARIGIVTMRERAEMAQGWMRIESDPETGTTVEFWLPSAEPLRAATP
jgi:signal transduction histidine kinase